MGLFLLVAGTLFLTMDNQGNWRWEKEQEKKDQAALKPRVTDDKRQLVRTRLK